MLFLYVFRNLNKFSYKFQREFFFIMLIISTSEWLKRTKNKTTEEKKVFFSVVFSFCVLQIFHNE